MKVIILSKNFMLNHPMAGELTDFKGKYQRGEKIHTLRANEKGYLKDGDVVSLRQWNGKPYASKQRIIQDGVQIGIEGVELNRNMGFGNVKGDILCRWVNVATIARNDGLSVDDFLAWMFAGAKKPIIKMDIIHFTGFRYAAGYCGH